MTGFSDVADEYRAAGWLGVMPLPPGQKSPPPLGFTGKYAAIPNDELIETWKESNPNGNVGLHLMDGVIGIDVDHYDHKQGGVTFEKAKSLWGELPSTARSSAREGISGIYFFRVPGGLHFPGEIEIDGTADIEIIQVAHRYAVVWPSINPKNMQQYVWTDVDGSPLSGIPNTETLPELPASWIEGLMSREGMHMGAGREKSRLGSQEAADRLSGFLQGEMCPVVSERLSVALSALEEPGNRHDAALLHTMALVGMGHDGHDGVLVALSALEEEFVALVSADRDGADSEFDRLIQGAVERLQGNQIAEDPCAAVEEVSEEDLFEAEVEKEVRRIKIKEEAKIRAHVEMFGELNVPMALTVEQLEEFAGEEEDWLVDGLIPRDGVSIIAAEKKAGKSTIIQKLAEALATGGMFLDTFQTHQVNGTIMIFDLELPEQKLGLWSIRNGIKDLPNVEIASLRGHVWDMNASDKRHRAKMVEYLKSINCKMLIVDPVGPYLRMLGLDECDATQAGSALDTLISLQVEAEIDTLLLTLHTGHGNKERARGSSVLMDIPDVNISLRKKGDDSPIRLLSAYGRDVDVDTISFQYDMETGSLDLVDDNDKIAQDRDDDTIHVLEILEDSPGLSKNRLQQAMKIRVPGCGEKRAMAALKQAVSRAFVSEMKAGDGQRAAVCHTLTGAGELELQHARAAQGA